MNLRIILYYVLVVILGYIGSSLLGHWFLKQAPVLSQKDDKLGSIVRLVRDGETICSGVVVNSHTILTASHCVMIDNPIVGTMINTEPFEIRDASNVPTGVEAVAYTARIQVDQALLTGDFHEFHTRTILTNIAVVRPYAHPGQSLVACGYPWGGSLYCSDMTFKEPVDFMWLTNGLLLPGMSGGPVLLPDGSVIAINIAVDKKYSVVSPTYNINMLFQEDK